MDTRRSIGEVLYQTIAISSDELSAHQLAPSLDEGGVANVHPNLMPPNSPSPAPVSPSPELSWIPDSEGSPSPDLHLHRLQQLSPGGFALSESPSGSSVVSPTIAGTVSILGDGGSHNSHPNLHNRSAHTSISPPDFLSYKEFMRSPELSDWKAACRREQEAFASNQTWPYVPWVPPTRIASPRPRRRAFSPRGYSDSSWADDPNQRRSTIGWVGVFSTSEAEYHAHLSQ
jgi:hypothetical protein